LTDRALASSTFRCKLFEKLIRWYRPPDQRFYPKNLAQNLHGLDQVFITQEAPMNLITPYDLLLMMAILLFLLGISSVIAGISILALRATSRDIQTLATQTSRLAQKGLAEDITGLVGNATDLLDAMAQMTRTTAGVGVFLTFLGLLLMGVAAWIAVTLFRMPL